MKFTSILKKIVLEESRFQVLRDKYTKSVKDESGKRTDAPLSLSEFLTLVQADPTSNMNNVDPNTTNERELDRIHVGNYTQWIINQYLNPKTERSRDEYGYADEAKRVKEVFMEDLYKVTDDLKKFDKFKRRLPEESRDINKLDTIKLYDLVKDFSLEKTKGTKTEKREAAVSYSYPGSEILFKGPNWTVVKISDTGELGRSAANFFGGYHLGAKDGETVWCTSSPGYTNHFFNHIKDGPLYVILPNSWSGERGVKSNLPKERFQFHFPSNQFKDIHNHDIDSIKYLNGPMKELKEVFKTEFAEGLTIGGKQLVIDNFRYGKVGKFISLYGIEEIFKNIPKTLENLVLKNLDSNLNLDIKIPKSISEFKNLDKLILENCISEVPDEICELPVLRFLAFPNNKNLRQIPDCIADMPNLYILNCRGCDNLKIPGSIKKRASLADENTPMVYDFL